MAQEYISQFPEKTEGRVIKKLSKDISLTESRILSVLSKLDEFFLNPHVRTFSVAVPWTSRSNNSENREPTGDRSLFDRCSEEVFCACHSSSLTIQSRKRLITPSKSDFSAFSTWNNFTMFSPNICIFLKENANHMFSKRAVPVRNSICLEANSAIVSDIEQEAIINLKTPAKGERTDQFDIKNAKYSIIHSCRNQKLQKWLSKSFCKIIFLTVSKNISHIGRTWLEKINNLLKQRWTT